MDEQLSTVHAIYEAFGRGDVAAILERMDDDVSWDEGLRQTDLPYLQPGRGRNHVAAFLGSLAATVAFDVFEPVAICGDGNGAVMVALREHGTNLVTGCEIAEDLAVHLWRIAPDGKVVSFRHIADLSLHEAAAAGHGARVPSPAV